MNKYNNKGRMGAVANTPQTNNSPEDKEVKMDEKGIICRAMKKSHEKGTYHKLSKIVCDLFDGIGEEDPEKLKSKFLLCLYEMANGKHFDEYTAITVVSGMVNVDGTAGEHWIIKEAKDSMEKYRYDSKDGKYNEYDWYVILNMMSSDYREVLGENVEIYIAMTNAYFNGPDEKEGKAWLNMSSKLFEESPEETEE